MELEWKHFVTDFINMPKDSKENMTVVKSIEWYKIELTEIFFFFGKNKIEKIKVLPWTLLTHGSHSSWLWCSLLANSDLLGLCCSLLYGHVAIF